MKPAKFNLPLKILLIEKGMTQRELAQKSGIHENYISLTMNGRYAPSQKQLQKIASVLGCSVQEIFNYEGITYAGRRTD